MFAENSIDFVQTYNNFRKIYPKKHNRNRDSVHRERFGLGPVRMAESVIDRLFDEKSLKGVKSCLQYEIRNMELTSYSMIIPEKRKFFDLSDSHIIPLLSDSLILSVIAYRVQLDEHGTGLANIVFNEILLGFEWVCDWQRRCVGITADKNDLIATHDIDHLKQFLR